ncbi:hypothetical protein KJ359_001919 [Pestalotiopsis sp. 9143b]|nr:hypothetical protein KJ359_001919 [Pestalotiopsis sp. 9143b]
MEKVWFKLRQTHYPPGPEESILAGEGDDSQAPICLGHCIADLKHLDFPINSGAVVPFPLRMNVYTSHVVDFEWERKRGLGTSAALAAGAPIAAALGFLAAKAGTKLAFKRSVTKYEQYGRIDTYTVRPNANYINQCLETAKMKEYIGNKSDWSFFMITGIKVARAGQRSKKVQRSAEVGGGPELNATAMMTLGATTENTVENSEQRQEGMVSDFVWAIRLAKVHKGVLMTDWSIGPYTRRATFETGNDQTVNVGSVVKAEGLDSFLVAEDDDLGEALVVDAR